MANRLHTVFRCLTLAAVCIFCGAVANVLFAWWVAATLDFNVSPSHAMDSIPRDSHPLMFRSGRVGVEAWHGFGYQFYFTLLEGRHPMKPLKQIRKRPDAIVDDWALSIVTPWATGGEWPHGRGRSLQGVLAVGWPRPALWCMYTSHRKSGTLSPYRGGVELTGWGISRSPGLTRALPYQPIWHGIAVNTVVYAAACWCTCLVFAPLRRSLRRRRGLCPACAYELRGTPAGSPCPECGK